MADESLQVGLKEWAAVCSAMEAGRQIVLLRKGGIYEADGEFEIEHRSFLLFSSHLHQKAEQIKPADRRFFHERPEEPEKVRISAFGRITDILQLRGREQMQPIDQAHIWGDELIDMRFNYRPENPLYLLLTRVYRLPREWLLEETPAYAGCKSWVPLERAIPIDGARAVIDDGEFARQRRRILEAIGSDAGRSSS